MPQFCDVALPVPLDSTFTYRVKDELPCVGARVLVPFREKKLPGIVVTLHDKPPDFDAKPIMAVLDAQPVLGPGLLQLGRWIADYYIAPLGEVYRTMLPLAAEFRRTQGYRITDCGLEVLKKSGVSGLFSQAEQDHQPAREEYAVLEYLGQRDGIGVREQALRSAAGAGKDVIQSLLRKKWIAREDLSAVRDATRTVAIAVLNEASGTNPMMCHPERSEGSAVVHRATRALNRNQEQVIAAVRDAGGQLSVERLRELSVPRTTLDTLVRRGLIRIEARPAEFQISSLSTKSPLGFVFNSAQKKALAHINAAVVAKKFSVALLHGITGSGKTAVYLAAMQQVQKLGRSAIMLVPEIGLTPAAAAQLHATFGNEVAILHSGLTDDERAEQWHRIRRGEARIVVGTRSAVFAPVHDLALIIVDEEHDHSYKQDETPRYNARDVAIVLAKQCGAAVVLGSATPALESYHNAERGKYTLIELPDRVEHRPLPEVEVIDMRLEFQEIGREQPISRRLVEEIRLRLDRGEQAMILLNRRGFSSVVLCRACGESIQCKNCAVAMTHHKRDRRMECHYCGYTERVPSVCPKCGSEYINFLGTGSEKLEDVLHSMFPQARIARLDRDTVRGRHDFERVLNALNEGDLDLLVGTQMIAKGHDIHGVTLVGVVGADAALAFPDFRAAERTFQLLAQVAGRAGRGETPGKVILQTYFAEHYAVQFAAKHDFRGFYDKESRFRSWMHYPPFTAVANVLVRGEELNEVLKYSGLLGNWFRDTRHEGVRVLGPAAAPLVRLKNDYRYHLVLKSASRARLNAILRAMLDFAAQHRIPRGWLVVDIDPVSLT
jgi:primosomal protein N' (replication factor Y)